MVVKEVPTEVTSVPYVEGRAAAAFAKLETGTTVPAGGDRYAILKSVLGKKDGNEPAAAFDLPKYAIVGGCLLGIGPLQLGRQRRDRSICY
jgi:hypothetical protein